MHSAPAVRYPVPRSARAGRALVALCSLPAVPCIDGWIVGLPTSAFLAIFVAWAVAVGACRFQWSRMDGGQLRWDGQAWWWLADAAEQRDEHAVEIALHLDLQSAVLVCMHGAPGRVRWRFMERSAAPALWNDVRRALHQRGTRTMQVPELHP